MCIADELKRNRSDFSGSGIRISTEGFSKGSSLYDGLELMIPMYQKNVSGKIRTGGCTDFVWKTDTGNGRFYLQKALTKNKAYMAPQSLWVLLKDRAYDIYGQTYDVKITLSNIKMTATQNIDAGKANWIGVAIGGGREQYPRQALMASPHASKAAIAERLADSPSVKTAAVARVATKTFTVSELSVGGTVEIPTSAAAPVDVKLTKPWWTLPVKGNVRFFSGAQPRDLGTRTTSGGGCSFGTADCNCVALFTSENSDVMPGMSLFFKKDETIELSPAVGLDNGTTVALFAFLQELPLFTGDNA